MRLLRLVVLLSAVYDLLLGGALTFALDETVRLIGIPYPRFPVNANLNGLFALAIGAGYLAILRRPEESRWYVWIMGPFLKGGGAILITLDCLLRGSPQVFLVFAATDGLLAGMAAWALTRSPRDPQGRDELRDEIGDQPRNDPVNDPTHDP